MNIDPAAVNLMAADKGITVDEAIDIIKSALLTAYRHTDGHEPNARIEIDRKTGVVRVMARETDQDGNLITEWDTPAGSSWSAWVARRRDPRGSFRRPSRCQERNTTTETACAATSLACRGVPGSR